MSEEDFDVESLAAYLHLTPQQVQRLVDRGKLPARKVGGTWRFSRPEIHHWLETRIGVSGEQQLVEMEDLLERSAAGDELAPCIADMLPAEAIAVPLAARTRNSVMTEMIQVAAHTGWLWDTRQMIEAVRSREEMHPTALDSGVALLHPRRPMPSILGHAFLAFGRTEQGIPFGGRSGLTDLFFLILSTDDTGHLRTLARLSRLIGDSEFLAQLRSAPDAAAIRTVIDAKEAELD